MKRKSQSVLKKRKPVQKHRVSLVAGGDSMELTEEAVQRLLKEEHERCATFLRKAVPPVWPRKLTLEAYVERSFLLHRRLLAAWGGWKYHAPAVTCEDPDVAIRAAAEEFNIFLRHVAALKNEQQFAVDPILLITNANSGEKVGHRHALAYKTVQPNYRGQEDEYAPCRFNEKEHNVSLGYVYTFKVSRTHHNQNSSDYTTTLLSGKCRVGQRISAVILRILEEHKAPTVYVELWEKMLQRLGETAWMPQRLPIGCTLSAAPSSFLKLGHYGENSCYKNGGGADGSKMWLSADVPDSMVLLFYRSSDAKDVEPEARGHASKVAARSWAIAVPGYGLLTSNFYLLSQQTVLPALLKAAQMALRIEKPELLESKISNELLASLTSGLYLNPDTKIVIGAGVLKRQFTLYYLRKVAEYASKAGLYSSRGASQEVKKRKATRVPAVWPYPDARLADMDDPERKGTILV